MSSNSERIDLSNLKRENQFLSKRYGRLYHRVQTELQRPLSGVHSIMMEKLAQAGEGGGARPPPFTIFTITYKVAVYAPAESADTHSPSFISTLCTLWSI
jgi:hypothetical protein